MSDVHVDAVAMRISPDAATFASLPLPLTRLIFLELPADARGRASCVCRAWRDVLASPALWTRLDMSFVSSDDDWQRCVSMLHGAARRARGQLRQLSLLQQHVVLGTPEVLLPVLTANAGSLLEFHLDHDIGFDDPWIPSYPSVEAVIAADAAGHLGRRRGMHVARRAAVAARRAAVCGPAAARRSRRAL
jgi:hypothetical protein